MANTARRGNAAELRVQKYHQEQGWVCGQRRHVGGAGDLLCVHPRYRNRVLEVKATQRPFDHFGPKDRSELLELADRIDADPLLAWSPTPSRIVLIPSSQWPGN